jgi:hypothetical protein
MGEEKEILLRGKICAYLTCWLMGDPYAVLFVTDVGGFDQIRFESQRG